MADKLLDLHDVAARLGVSHMTARNMRARGQLPPCLTGLGRRVRWRESDFDAWLAALPQEAS